MAILTEVWDTRRLRLLVEVGRRGSLSAAARQINLSQPAASEHFRRLESAAGQPLAERTGRGLRLTGAGKVLAYHASQALSSLEAAQEYLDAYSGLRTGTLRLGSTPVPGTYILPNAIARFRRRFPEISIDVDIATTHDVIRSLKAGSVQLALVCTEVEEEDILTEPFAPDEIVACAAPGLIPETAPSPPTTWLAGQTLLAREEGSSSGIRVQALCEKLSIRWGRVWTLQSIEAIKQAAQMGLGVGFLSRATIVDELQRGVLAVVDLGTPIGMLGSFSTAHLKYRRLTPTERAFCALLASSVQGAEV